MRRSIRAGLLACLTAIAVSACGAGHHTTTTNLHPGPRACVGYETQWGCSAHSPSFGVPPTGPPRLTAPSSTPTVAMYDSVTISVIPHGSAAVAGYLSGNFPTYQPLLSAFPAAYHVAITPQAVAVPRSLVPRMVCLDVEPRDATPAEAGPWARGEIQMGLKPCIYSSLKNGMSESEGSLAGSLGSGWRSKVFLWDADWTGSPHLDAGFDGTQWTDHFGNLNLDASVVAPTFLGVDPGPKPIGGAQHYERYPQAPERPHRERATVQGWDSHHCLNPVRRPVCKVTRAHLLYDLGRDQSLYAHDSKTLRNTLRLPGRIQGLVHRLDGRGVVRAWL